MKNRLNCYAPVSPVYLILVLLTPLAIIAFIVLAIIKIIRLKNNRKERLKWIIGLILVTILAVLLFAPIIEEGLARKKFRDQYPGGITSFSTDCGQSSFYDLLPGF